MTIASTQSASRSATLSRRLLFKALSRFTQGSLTLEDADDHQVFGNLDSAGPQAATWPRPSVMSQASGIRLI